jgi:tellurite resistance protein TehA-like permease
MTVLASIWSGLTAPWLWYSLGVAVALVIAVIIWLVFFGFTAGQLILYIKAQLAKPKQGK